MRVDKELGKIRKKFASGNVLTGVASFKNADVSQALLSMFSAATGFFASGVALTGAVTFKACLSGMRRACLRPYTDSCM